MADKDVETKVVQVRFDNSKFSKKVEKTIKQCDKLDKKLQFKGRSKDIKEVQEAIDKVQMRELNKDLEKTDSVLHKITVGLGELLKLKVLSKILDTVINKTSSLIKNMMGIENVLAGWHQYETQVTNVGGILNQVESKGKTINDVADAMERLQWYTDETSFNFTTLSNGIRQFVIAGIDLNEAAEAAMGVTNLAGSAKVFDEYKIQSAMDAVSKAMQTGYMDTLKWTTLTNTAGIVTEEFSEALLEEAAAQGKLIKDQAGQYKTRKSGKRVTKENIRNTLSDKWLTSNVLSKVMNRYSSASTAVEKFTDLMSDQTDESLKKINEMFEQSGKQFSSFSEIITQMPEDIKDSTEFTSEQAVRYLKNLGYAFDEIALKAFESSQETTTFSQAVKFVGDSIKTQWASIFQSIFGDYEQATRLWSDVSNLFDNIFVSPFRHLSEVFDKWSKLENGGAEDFRKTLLTIIEIIGKFKKAISNAFVDIFGEVDESWLQKITIALKNFFDSINKKENFNTVKSIFKIIGAFFKTSGKVIGTVLQVILRLVKALEPLFTLISNLIGKMADGIVWLIDYIDSLGILDKIVEGITWSINKLVKGIKKIVEWVKTKVDLKKVCDGLSKAIDKIKETLTGFINKIKESFEKTKKWVEESELFQKASDGYSKSIEKIKKSFSGFGKSTDEATEGLEKVENAGEKVSEKMGWIDSIKNAFISLGNMLKTIYNTVYQFLDKTGVIDILKGIITPIFDIIKGFWNELKQLAADSPDEALKKIGKLVLTILGFLTLLYTNWIISNVEGITFRLYRAAGQFRLILAAFKWKVIAGALKHLAISILMLSISVYLLANMKVEAKKAWMAVGIISTFIAQYMLIFIYMNKFAKGFLRGIGASFIMIGTAIALSVFISKLKKILEVVGNYSTSQIWKAMGVLGAMIGGWCAILFTTFRKVETSWIIKKSGKMVGPSLIKMAVLILFVYKFLKIALWFVDQIKDVDDSVLIRAGISFGACMAFVIGMLATITIVTKKKSNIGEILGLSSTILSLVPIIIAAYYVIKLGGDIDWNRLKNGAAVLGVLFAFLIAVIIGVSVVSHILAKKGVVAGVGGVKIASNIMALTLPILAGAAVFKIIQSLGLTTLQLVAIGGFVILLFIVIGAISVALNATSSLVERTIGRGGLIFRRNRSPIGGALMAISFTVLMMVGVIKLLAFIKPEEFQEGMKKIAQMMGFIVVCLGLLLFASRYSRSLGVAKLLNSLIITVAAILIMAKVLSLQDENGNPLISDEYIMKATGVFVRIGALVFLLLWSFKFINKEVRLAVKESLAAMILILTVVATIYAIIGVIKILEELSKEENFTTGVTTVIVIIAAITASLIFIFKALNGLKMNVAGRNSYNTIVLAIWSIIVMVLAITGAIYLATMIPKDKYLQGVNIVILAVASAILLVATVMTSIKLMKGVYKLRSKILDLMMIIGLILLAIGGMIIAISEASKIDQDKAVVGEEMVVLSALIVGVMLQGIVHAIKSMNRITNLDKKVKSLFGIVAIIMIALTAIIIAIIRVSKEPTPKIWLGMAMVTLSVGIIIAIIFAFIGAIKLIKSDPTLGKDAMKLMLIVGLMMVAIYGIILAVSWVGSMSWQKAFLGMNIVIAIMGSIIVMIFAVISAAAVARVASLAIFDIVLLGTIMNIVAASILGIAAGMMIIALIPDGDFTRAAITIGVIAAALLIIVFLMVGMAKLFKNGKEAIISSLAVLILLAGVVASIFLIALALKMIAGIDPDRLKQAAIVLGIMMGVMVVLLIVLGVIASSGIGAGILLAVAGIMLAVGAALLMIAGAIWIVAKAIDQLVDSFIKLSKYLSTKSPEQALKEFKSACIQGATAIVGFQTALINLGSAIINFTSTSINAFGQVIKALGDFISSGIGALSSMFKAFGDSKEADAVRAKAEAYQLLAASLSTLQNVDIGRIEGNIKWLNDFFGNVDSSNIIKFSDTMKEMDRVFINLLNRSGNYKNAKEILYLVKDIINGVNYSFGGVIAKYIDKFQAMLIELSEMEDLTITPKFDFTEFNEGLEYMRENLSQYAYGIQSSASSIDMAGKENRNKFWDRKIPNESQEIDGNIIINQNFTLTDAMSYSYDAQRATANGLKDAMRNIGFNRRTVGTK